MISIEPSKTFLMQARKLALLGASDEDIADFFSIRLDDLTRIANLHPVLLEAITPTEQDFEAHKARFAVSRAKRQVVKKRYLDGSPSARIRASTAARLWAALKGKTKGGLFSRLNYTVAELMIHLEGKFSDGMTWENYGAWHIDHRKPCVLFDQQDPVQFAECWALSNLQPLWAIDNIKKGARYAGS